MVDKAVKVMLGIPTAEMARRADFYDYVNLMNKPPNTVEMRSHGQSPARNRNLIIEQALHHECTHIFFLDDDVAFHPTILMNLLKHDLDIVSGLYLMRNYPHKPIMFDRANSNGTCRFKFLENGETGLVEVVATGLGCCLIKTDVFRNIEKPWIRLGELELDHWCDDIGFFLRVREAGYKIHVDLDNPVGHICSMIVWPDRRDNKWLTVYDTSGEGVVSFPAVRPALLVEA